jgi:hypothetical protein
VEKLLDQSAEEEEEEEWRGDEEPYSFLFKQKEIDLSPSFVCAPPQGFFIPTKGVFDDQADAEGLVIRGLPRPPPPLDICLAGGHPSASF